MNVTMRLLERAASDWWQRMSAHEQEAYLRAHPGSRFGHARRTVEATLQRYLRPGSDQERQAAENALNRMGVPLPEEPLPPPRWDKFVRETVRTPRARSRPTPRDKPSGSARPRGFPTRDPHAMSDALVANYGMTSPDVARGIASHRAFGSSADRLHRDLLKNGWSHTEHSLGNQTTLHTYRHADGGHLKRTERGGTISGRTIHTVHVHPDA